MDTGLVKFANHKIYNNHMHSESKKRRGYRYAPATPFFAAGDVMRSTTGPISFPD